MDYAPKPPSEDTVQTDEAKIRDGRFPPYRRQAAQVSVRESVRDGLPTELCPNDFGDEGATLLGGRCQPWYGPALPAIGTSGIADHVDVGQMRDRKIGLNLDSACIVGIHIEPFRGWRCCDAGSPQHRF